MWEIAAGFRPRLDGLTQETRMALDRLGERVRAMGGRLVLTSAYRPGNPRLHGRGAAVDVWVPGWSPERIKEAAAGTGFIGGYVPHGGRRFIELVTEPYWYGIRRGDKFVVGAEGAAPMAPAEVGGPVGWLMDLMRRRREEFNAIIRGERAAIGERVGMPPPEIVGIPGIPEAGWEARIGIILVAVVLLVVMVVLLVKSV